MGCDAAAPVLPCSPCSCGLCPGCDRLLRGCGWSRDSLRSVHCHSWPHCAQQAGAPAAGCRAGSEGLPGCARASQVQSLASDQQVCLQGIVQQVCQAVSPRPGS